MGYGGRVARTALTTRADAEALDAADPLAAFRDRFALGDGRRIYVDGNSLGPVALDAQAALEGRIGEWRDRLVTGWNDWVDAADGGRRPARRGRARGGAGAGARVGLDDRQPLQARRRSARRPAGRDRRRRRPTSPPTATSSRAWPPGRAASCACSPPTPSPARSRPRSSRRARAARRWSCCRAVELPLRARWRGWPRSRPPARPRARSCCGICATRPVRSRSTSTRSAPTWPSAAPTST